MASAVQEVLDILDLEPLEVNLFRGQPGSRLAGRLRRPGHRPGAGRRGRTVGRDRRIHSTPTSFARGRENPIVYDVDRIRDGGASRPAASWRSRRPRDLHDVGLIPPGRAGTDHQDAMPDVPTPKRCRATRSSRTAAIRRRPKRRERYYEGEQPIEIPPRSAADDPAHTPKPAPSTIWIRTTGRLPDEPAIHRYVLAYASDHAPRRPC